MQPFYNGFGLLEIQNIWFMAKNFFTHDWQNSSLFHPVCLDNTNIETELKIVNADTLPSNQLEKLKSDHSLRPSYFSLNPGFLSGSLDFPLRQIKNHHLTSQFDRHAGTLYNEFLRALKCYLGK